MAIEIKEVEHVAKLARLALSNAEKALYAGQLNKIIHYFAQLQEVETGEIEPLTCPLALSNVLREDEVCPPPGSAILLQTAPASEGGYFRVPKIGE